MRRKLHVNISSRPEILELFTKKVHYASHDSFKGKAFFFSSFFKLFFTRAQFKKKDTSPFLDIILFLVFFFYFSERKRLALTSKWLCFGTDKIFLKSYGSPWKIKVKKEWVFSEGASANMWRKFVTCRPFLFFFCEQRRRFLCVFTGSCKTLKPCRVVLFLLFRVFFFFSLAHEWCNLLVWSMHVWIGGGGDCDIEGVFGLEIGESSHAVAFHRTET